MSFQALTEHYQQEINQFASRPVNDEMLDEVQTILEEYCFNLEENYGLLMKFKVWYSEKEDKLKYKVIPASDLDNELLRLIVENESKIGRFTMTIQ